MYKNETYLLPFGGFGPVLPSRISLEHDTPAFFVRWPTGIGASGPRLQLSIGSTLPALMKPLDQSEEDALPWIPRQQPINQPPSRPHDLAWHLDERRAVRRELHPQQRSFFRLVFGPVPRRYRNQQSAPGLKAPRQRSHYHVRPVADQVVHRRGQGANTAFQWAIKFSCSQRSLSQKTTSSAVIWRSLVM